MNRRELTNLVLGMILIAAFYIVLSLAPTVIEAIGVGRWWYQIDLYADHHHHWPPVQMYLPLIFR